MQSSKTVLEIGEFGLIERLKKILAQPAAPDVIIGIGDDTAVIRLDDNRALLATCDIQVQNQHFRLENMSAYQLGRRAMAVNLSDIAAMAGRPTFALVSLACPGSLPLEDFDQLFQGMHDQLSDFSARVIGGNLSRCRDGLIIDITLLGEAEPSRILTRSGASPGDRILVTGIPGLSAAGFYLLEKFGRHYPAQFAPLVQKHLQPIARIELAQRLAQTGMVTAMIDTSDGLVSDLSHICELSHVSAMLNREKIPLPGNMTEIENTIGKNWHSLAHQGGEDYELLVTVKPETSHSVIQKIAADTCCQVTEIGRIVPLGQDLVELASENGTSSLAAAGWNHFR